MGDYYLHFERWVPHFFAETVEITHLPVRIRFPLLPVEYYLVQCLQQAGNQISRTLKVDSATLLASRGRFARVCVEIDLRQPLKSGYRFKHRTWKLQYKGLQVFCFHSGRYGHSDAPYPKKVNAYRNTSDQHSPSMSRNANGCQRQSSIGHPNTLTYQYREWMIADCRHLHLDSNFRSGSSNEQLQVNLS